jgi:hypothetical protein
VHGRDEFTAVLETCSSIRYIHVRRKHRLDSVLNLRIAIDKLKILGSIPGQIGLVPMSLAIRFHLLGSIPGQISLVTLSRSIRLSIRRSIRLYWGSIAGLIGLVTMSRAIRRRRLDVARLREGRDVIQGQSKTQRENTSNDTFHNHPPNLN